MDFYHGNFIYKPLSLSIVTRADAGRRRPHLVQAKARRFWWWYLVTVVAAVCASMTLLHILLVTPNSDMLQGFGVRRAQQRFEMSTDVMKGGSPTGGGWIPQYVWQPVILFHADVATVAHKKVGGEFRNPMEPDKEENYPSTNLNDANKSFNYANNVSTHDEQNYAPFYHRDEGELRSGTGSSTSDHAIANRIMTNRDNISSSRPKFIVDSRSAEGENVDLAPSQMNGQQRERNETREFSHIDDSKQAIEMKGNNLSANNKIVTNSIDMGKNVILGLQQNTMLRILVVVEPFEKKEAAKYQHPLLALAEGLIELGHDVQGTNNYWPVQRPHTNRSDMRNEPWQSSPHWLIKRARLRQADSDMITSPLHEARLNTSNKRREDGDKVKGNVFRGEAPFDVIISGWLSYFAAQNTSPTGNTGMPSSLYRKCSAMYKPPRKDKMSAGASRHLAPAYQRVENAAADGAVHVLLDWRLGDKGESYYSRVLYGGLFDLYYLAHKNPFTAPSCTDSPQLRPGCFGLTQRLIDVASRLESLYAHHRKSGSDAPNTRRENRIIFAHGKLALTQPVRRKAVQLYSQYITSVPLIRSEQIANNNAAKKENSNLMNSQNNGLVKKTEWDDMLKKHTGGRHNIEFYDYVWRSSMCDASGGYFKPWEGDSQGTIQQWESFKVWEYFALGCAVILPDLKHYRLELPIMPDPFVHYIPVVYNAESFQKFESRLITGDIDARKIGAAGQAWALLHYSPKAIASRFVRDVRTVARSKPVPSSCQEIQVKRHTEPNRKNCSST